MDTEPSKDSGDGIHLLPNQCCKPENFPIEPLSVCSKGNLVFEPNSKSEVLDLPVKDSSSSKAPCAPGKCEVCGKPTSQFCQKCCVTYYCSRIHQREAWKQHKSRCFPVHRIQKEENEPKELVVSRDVSQGEVFLKEYPILIYPHSSYSAQTICLECCNPIYDAEGVVPCAECGWELCSETCQEEEHGHHRKNECPIFRKWKEAEADLTDMFQGKNIDKYFGVGLLRALLMREMKPDLWALIEKMNSFRKERAAMPDHDTLLKTYISWIHNDCGMATYDEDTIDHVIGALNVNSIDASDHFTLISSPSHKNASLLFPLSSLTGRNCVANARFSIKGRNTGDFQIFVIANVPIPKGSPVNFSTEHGLSGTFIRRALKQKLIYCQCQCERCKDPTELGTFISALKCHGCHNETSYFLQSNPVQDNSPWTCINCEAQVEYRQALVIVEETSDLLQSGVGMEPTMESVLYLLKCITQLKKKLLHPNHFVIINAEVDICKRLLILASSNDFGGREDLMIELSKHVLSVADILTPGYSRFRGQILYCLQFAMVGNLLKASRFTRRTKLKEGVMRGRKGRLEECRKYQGELQKIFEKEPDDSEEQVMLNAMKARMDVIA